MNNIVYRKSFNVKLVQIISLCEDSRHQFRFIHEIVTTQWIHFLLQSFSPLRKTFIDLMY